jgi:hypothetical protein
MIEHHIEMNNYVFTNYQYRILKRLLNVGESFINKIYRYTVKHVYNGHPWDRLKEVPDKTEIWTGR